MNKVAICTMVRKPFNFDTWLDYHLTLVDHIFLRVEETPNLSEVIDKYGDKITVEYSNVENKAWDQTWGPIKRERQKKFTNEVIKKCQDLNINWLAHIDSDELICANDLEFLNKIDEDIQCVIIQNYEAVYPIDNLDNPFLQTNRFIRNNMTSYVNGKSFGRVSSNIELLGPHRFSGKKIDTNVAKILHFESPTFDKWLEKFQFKTFSVENSDIEDIFNTHRDRYGNWHKFLFYKESIKVIESGDMKKCRELYNKSKVDRYYEEGTMKLYWTPLLKEKNINWAR